MTEIDALRERAKELRCLYRVGEAVAHKDEPPHLVFRSVIEAIPEGWQHPETTGARIEYLGRSYVGPGFSEDAPRLRAPIRLWSAEVGSIEVSDSHPNPEGADPFLPEERELIDNVAARLTDYLEWKHQELVGERIGAAGEHWRWRQHFAERLARKLDPERFGVKAIYLIGSTETGEAGPGSDIDLTIVFDGTEAQREALLLWLEGWSLCLAELAFRQTGAKISGGLLDVHLTDKPPADRTRRRELPLGKNVG